MSWRQSVKAYVLNMTGTLSISTRSLFSSDPKG
jgi:hypothetical protein